MLHLYEKYLVTLWPNNVSLGHKVTNMNKEIWKDIFGYENLYQISSEGRVKRLRRLSIDSLGRKRIYNEKILVNCICKATGYPYVNLSKNGKVTTWNIHTLVADAFIPNPNNLPCINHIDENRSNSVLSNLERCTYAYNNSYGTARERRRDSLRRYFEKNNIPMNFLKRDVCLSIVQYTLKGAIVAFFKGGYPEIRERLGYGESIYACVNHKNKSAYGYVWRYVGDDFSYKPRVKKLTEKIKNSIKSHQKYVIKIDKNGIEIERYKSISEAGEKNGFDRHLFSRVKCVDGVVTIKGMRFVVEQKENEYIPKGHKGARPDLLGKCAKPVCQYSKDGEFIREYKSVKEAAESIGFPKAAPEISSCCNGNLKSARGYIWVHKGGKEPKPFHNNAIRKIEQYSFDGELIATHKSILDAMKAVGGKTATCIGNNLRGRSHSAYGYIWKYAKD